MLEIGLLLGHIVVLLRMLALRAGMVGLVVSWVWYDGNVGMPFSQYSGIETCTY